MRALEKKLREELEKAYFSQEEIEKLLRICKVVIENIRFNSDLEVETNETGVIVDSNIVQVLSYAFSKDWEELNPITLKRMMLLKTLELSHEERVLKEYWRYQHEMKQVKLEPEADKTTAIIVVKKNHQKIEEDLEKLKTHYNKALQYLIENQTKFDFFSLSTLH